MALTTTHQIEIHIQSLCDLECSRSYELLRLFKVKLGQGEYLAGMRNGNVYIIL